MEPGAAVVTETIIVALPGVVLYGTKIPLPICEVAVSGALAARSSGPVTIEFTVRIVRLSAPPQDPPPKRYDAVNTPGALTPAGVSWMVKLGVLGIAVTVKFRGFPPASATGFPQKAATP